jgi:hypothetical protein
MIFHIFHNGCGFEIRCRNDDAMGKSDVPAYLRSLRICRYVCNVAQGGR